MGTQDYQSGSSKLAYFNIVILYPWPTTVVRAFFFFIMIVAVSSINVIRAPIHALRWRGNIPSPMHPLPCSMLYTADNNYILPH